MAKLLIYKGRIVTGTEQDPDGTIRFKRPRRLGDVYTTIDLQTGAETTGKLRRKQGPGGKDGERLNAGADGILAPLQGGGPNP